MDKKLKQQISEEQYKFYKYIFDKIPWFVLSFAISSLNIISLDVNNKLVFGLTIGVMSGIISAWFLMFFQMNKEHNKLMETIGGKNWRKVLYS